MQKKRYITEQVELYDLPEYMARHGLRVIKLEWGPSGPVLRTESGRSG